MGGGTIASPFFLFSRYAAIEGSNDRALNGAMLSSHNLADWIPFVEFFATYIILCGWQVDCVYTALFSAFMVKSKAFLSLAQLHLHTYTPMDNCCQCELLPDPLGAIDASVSCPRILGQDSIIILQPLGQWSALLTKTQLSDARRSQTARPDNQYHILFNWKNSGEKQVRGCQSCNIPPVKVSKQRRAIFNTLYYQSQGQVAMP